MIIARSKLREESRPSEDIANPNSHVAENDSLNDVERMEEGYE